MVQHGWKVKVPYAKKWQKQAAVSENVSLRKAYEELLIQLRVTDESDSQFFTGLLLQIESFLEGHPQTTCNVYQMSKGKERVRSVNDDEEMPTLFQGANYADAAHKDMVYPGDDHIRSDDGVTIQIHTLEVRQKDRSDSLYSSRRATQFAALPPACSTNCRVQSDCVLIVPQRLHRYD